MSQQSPSCPENPWELGLTASKPELPMKLRWVDGLESSTLLLWKLSYHRKLLSVVSEGVRRAPPAIAQRFDSKIKEKEPFYSLEGPCLEHVPADEQLICRASTSPALRLQLCSVLLCLWSPACRAQCGAWSRRDANTSGIRGLGR